jgi:HD-like signal output (HDOD) protein
VNPAPASAPAPAAAAGAPAGSGLELVEAGPPSDPFTPFARALGLPVPAAPAPLDEVEELAELELAARVLDHCRRNKLGPASAPTLSLRILNLVATPDVEVTELARTIAADPALSAGLLNVANSAYYRGLSEIETIRDAITRLGFDEVGRVAGALSAKSLFNPKLRQELAAFGPRFSALYRRAITVATGAAALAMRCRGARSDRAYLGGMLHDVGRTVALRAVATLTLEGGLVLGAADPRLGRLLDRVHVEVGGEVHQEWQLPLYLTVLAVRHHDAGIPSDADFVDLHVVRLAAAVHDLRADPAAARRAADEIVQSAGALRLDPNGVRELAAELRQAEEKVAVAFGLDGAGPRRGAAR